MKTVHRQRSIEEGLGGPLRATPSIARAKPALELSFRAGQSRFARELGAEHHLPTDERDGRRRDHLAEHDRVELLRRDAAPRDELVHDERAELPRGDVLEVRACLDERRAKASDDRRRPMIRPIWARGRLAPWAVIAFSETDIRSTE